MTYTPDTALQVNQLPISQELPRDEERMRETLTLWMKLVATAVNTKEGGLYDLQELFSFKQFFTAGNPNVFRNNYRDTFDITGMNGGPIAGGATVSFAHHI